MIKGSNAAKQSLYCLLNYCSTISSSISKRLRDGTTPLLPNIAVTTTATTTTFFITTITHIRNKSLLPILFAFGQRAQTLRPWFKIFRLLRARCLAFSLAQLVFKGQKAPPSIPRSLSHGRLCGYRLRECLDSAIRGGRLRVHDGSGLCIRGASFGISNLDLGSFWALTSISRPQYSRYLIAGHDLARCSVQLKGTRLQRL